MHTEKTHDMLDREYGLNEVVAKVVLTTSFGKGL